MRPPSSISSLSGRNTPMSLNGRSSSSDLKRPASARGYRPHSPRATPTIPRSRPGSSLGSRPSTPSFRAEPYSGSITVSIRPNPFTDTANMKNWHIEEHSNTIVNLADSSSFSFDNVFPAATSVSNREVYDRSCSHIVKSFLHEGYNSTLFAYGMTGSGKTYSMRGEDHDPGFVRLAIDEIFQKIDLDSSKKYELNASYLEIYNEKIIDLLLTGPTSTDLKIRDDPEFGTKIVGVSSPAVLSKEHLLQLIRTGDAKRKTSATDYNARSSRSHSILQIRLHTLDPMSNTELRCTLSLCDLAGSERATSSAERRKEGAFINKSLLALSTVINKLSLVSTATYNTGIEHIPYRDSKLTRLLQPALSGSSLILILCTVHLGSSQLTVNQQFVSETYNTLRFAARAKDIVMTVNTNKKQTLGDGEAQKIIQELKKTVESQKNEIQLLKLQANTRTLSGGLLQTDNTRRIAELELEAETRVLQEKVEHLTRLTDLQKTETVLLRNDALNDILGIDVDKASLQMMMSNLEEFYKRVNYEMDEYKSYVARLEDQLRLANQKLSLQGPITSRSSAKLFSEKHYEEMLKDQEEEIWQLKETIKDKDHIIHGLTKTSKLRRLVDSNTLGTTSDSGKRPSITSLNVSLLLGSDKENVFQEIREFNLSPKRNSRWG
ncbi:CIC11C00000003037 [Sungouiella intermedia]|uniref:CIC11C00000003037 n=1 Tax=Sungouiella intermedia TaxID=45354 RepID=A0A1L0GCG3_9ASCO|nr:CIC11C00000003037 [[Candida] intermedia]